MTILQLRDALRRALRSGGGRVALAQQLLDACLRIGQRLGQLPVRDGVRVLRRFGLVERAAQLSHLGLQLGCFLSQRSALGVSKLELLGDTRGRGRRVIWPKTPGRTPWVRAMLLQVIKLPAARSEHVAKAG